jgi:nicotinate phosphoribosyltransferase
MGPIIKSIIDTDLYKLTMQQAVIKKFPNAVVKYTFFNRGDHEFPDTFKLMLQDQLTHMKDLKLTPSEKSWLRINCPYLDPTYLDFLTGYQYDPNEVKVKLEDGKLEIQIEGYWYRTIMWEVPLMALISELYFKTVGEHPWDENARINNNREKYAIFRANGAHFADFGTRRRFSFDVQKEFVENAIRYAPDNFVGTSNVYLAYEFNTKAIGTHAHEWFMFHAAKYGYKMANGLAMENWTDVYRGDLGIALSDTFTSNVFFGAFDRKFAKLYDGVRHDSGEPLEFADKVIKHYESLGIDPKSKAIIFSDSLNAEKAIEIKNYCRGKIKCSFGIGTNFTNDVGVKPLNMVIKLTDAKPEGESWRHCIKLSDSEGKHTGHWKEIEMAKYFLNIE